MSLSSNIQVIVRCRGRNSRELAARLQPVVDLLDPTFSVTSPTVTVNNETDISTTALLALKTYTVDQVYGSQADQELVFANVAAPLVEDFVRGLNVTIMTYGQTGTGKTYTMTGDLEGDAERAGIIPRALEATFAFLEREKTDYMVKCACVELYQENLRDLLGDDDPSPNARLRIISDPKDAIVVHNLREVHIDSSIMGLSLLKKCLAKRRTGQTRLNDLSSRSHTIFTISLYKKMPNAASFRVSKMNLVDLAGSEDINKSGAVNQRAKEAGSINQSLLTLGKVINALSEGRDKSHVPFRESKLTRLLQDLIGGRTKTSLIATISPAKINIQETVSTLNYASKAKNIRNLPQLGHDNEEVLKKILVQDLSREIIKITKDLYASKDKESGGIKMSIENYKEHAEKVKNLEYLLNEKSCDMEGLKSKLKEKERELSSLKSAILEHAQTEESLKAELCAKDEKIASLNDLLQKTTESYKSQSKHLSRIIDNNLLDIMQTVETVMKDSAKSDDAVQNSVSSFHNQMTDNIVRFKKEFKLKLSSIQKSISLSRDEIADVLSKKFTMADSINVANNTEAALRADIASLKIRNQQMNEYIHKQAENQRMEDSARYQAEINEAFKQKLLGQVAEMINAGFVENNTLLKRSFDSAFAEKSEELTRRANTWALDCEKDFANIDGGVSGLSETLKKVEKRNTDVVKSVSESVCEIFQDKVTGGLEGVHAELNKNNFSGTPISDVKLAMSENNSRRTEHLKSVHELLDKFQAIIGSERADPVFKSPLRLPTRVSMSSPNRPLRLLSPVRIVPSNIDAHMDGKSRIPQLSAVDKENFAVKRRRT